MYLTPERESELIEQNMQKIYRSVDNFMAKSSKRDIDYDDFVQEVSIAFLEYIRGCETEEQLEHFPWYDATQAMSRLVLASQPIKVPYRTTRNFKQTMQLVPRTVSLDALGIWSLDVDGMSKKWVSDKEFEMDFFDFMSAQGESVQRIVAMLIYGMSRSKIASQCGVTKTAIIKRLDRLKTKYDVFSQEDSDDE